MPVLKFHSDTNMTLALHDMGDVSDELYEGVNPNSYNSVIEIPDELWQQHEAEIREIADSYGAEIEIF